MSRDLPLSGRSWIRTSDKRLRRQWNLCRRTAHSWGSRLMGQETRAFRRPPWYGYDVHRITTPLGGTVELQFFQIPSSGLRPLPSMITCAFSSASPESPLCIRQ